MKWIGLVLIALLVACGPMDEQQSDIETLREALATNKAAVKAAKAKPDSLLMMKLGRKLEAYALGHPKQKVAPEMLMEAGVLFQSGLGDIQKAFTLYSHLAENYREHALAEDAIIQMAGIAHADMHNEKVAEKLYKAYLASYPNGKYRRTAREAILLFEGRADSTEVLPKKVQEAIKASKDR